VILLNIGCGAQRPPLPFLNVDDLFNHFPEGHRERPLLTERLRSEGNYINQDLRVTPWVLDSESVDGILASHFFEHFDTQDALRLFKECYRVLKPGGVLRVAVPNATYFREVNPEDRRENWVRLFEDVNDVSENHTYMGVALFFVQHKQTYTEDALWCQLSHAGFGCAVRVAANTSDAGQAGSLLAMQDNRPKFSLFMEAIK
jgi:SAM-dependent methyltransferase